MAPRDYIIHPSEYDLGNVIADIHAIRRLNKQRFEMEQLTAIVHEDEARGLCVGYKDISPDEFWVRGHFPGMAVMPGVMMCEAAAQLSSYYTQKHNLLGLDAHVVGFGGLEEVRFREPVVPGDRLVITVERIIGFKRGTGGTAGVSYLQSTLSKRAFPELWTLRSRL